MISSPREILTIYKIYSLREKGWTNKRIASELGMTTQNLYHLMKVHSDFHRNLIVERLMEYQTDDPVLKRLLLDASINILRLKECIQNAIVLPKEEPPATLQG